VIRWLRARFAARRRALQDRLALLIAIAVFCGVAVTGAAAAFITWRAIYNQLDTELTTVANITSAMFEGDIRNMGGINETALLAANVNLWVLRADNTLFSRPDSPDLHGPAELAVAMTGEGASARTGYASDGRAYRIIAVPLSDVENPQSHYALILARPLDLTVITSLLYALGFFGALAIVAAAAVGFSIARSSIEPLRQLNAAVAQVTATNRLVPVAVQGQDEVADLGRSFNRMLKALDSSRERQRRLIADAGHELRTPLTSMRTNVELLVADDKSGMLPQGARGDILRDVAAQLGEFTTLIGDLVQLSREDEVRPHPEAIDLRDVVSSSLERVKRRGGPGITWDVVLNNPLYLLGEPDALERAVTNLLDNAVKFSPPDGTIHVDLTGDRLRVADEGPGIADEDLPHVFERFYRSDKARNTPGSGLGLSIVAQTIHAHGGWVQAAHAAEGGAEFLVRLPGTETDPEDEASADADTGAQPAVR